MSKKELITISKDLLAFVAVAEELHFGRAAERLHISQPPLSQQIRRFEAGIGMELFVRTTRSVQLTQAGKLLLEHAHNLLSHTELALERLRRCAQGDQSSLRIGLAHSSVYDFLPKLLRDFKVRFADVRLDIQQSTSDLLIEAVERGRLDLAVLRMDDAMFSKDIAFRIVAQDPMHIVVAKDWMNQEDIKALMRGDRPLPWISYDPYTASYLSQLEKKFLRQNQVKTAIKYVSVMPSIQALAEAGMGFALLPLSAIKKSKNLQRVQPVQGSFMPGKALMHCVWRSDNGNPAIQEFLDCIEQIEY